MIADLRICVVGAGKMGEALIHGLISKKTLDSDNIFVAEISNERREYISLRYNVKCSGDVTEFVQKCNLIIIAVKPKDVKDVAETMSRFVTLRHLIVTLAAGVSTGFLSRILGSGIPIIRAMPNIAVLVGEGMVALAKGPNSSADQMALAEKIFSSVGRVVPVDEKYMDAVTGLSGSGPAYIYTVIEALSDGGVKVGLDRALATFLAAQTTLGAAKMVLETKEHPAKLRDKVATPGGTTVEGLLQLEKSKVREAIIKAVVKATEKSKRLMIK